MSQNSFNTTPDGNTIVTINSGLEMASTTLILDSSTTPNIDNIFVDNPTITTFIFNAGTYNLTDDLKILVDGIQMLGATGYAKDVHIVQQTSGQDGIVIKANDVVLQDMSIHCPFSGTSCLITADCNNSVVSGNYFYGCNDHFAIYYAGPSSLAVGQSTLDGYTNYTLDEGNVFYKNVVYSDYSGDSISFSLQYLSQFVGNFIRGGKVAIYMCRTTNVYNNTIVNSTSNGIYVSLPSDNLSIICNKIYHSTYSSIKISNQVEHGSFTSYNYNIVVQHNKIHDARLYGMELNYCVGITVKNNKLDEGDNMGIYCYSGDYITIQSNKIAYFNFGLWLEATTNSLVDCNTIMSVYPDLGQNGIKLTSDSTSNSVTNNTLYGKYQYDLIADSGSNDTVSGNVTIPYYTLTQELAIYEVVS